jgi:hypothetical protein
MNRILLAFLLTLVSHNAYLKAQQVDTTFNTILDEGYQIFKLVEVSNMPEPPTYMNEVAANVYHGMPW